jgi:hypothetical protein
MCLPHCLASLSTLEKTSKNAQEVIALRGESWL